MIRTYQFRVNPTSKQYDRLFEMRRDFCDLYNAALQERRDAWQTTDYAHVTKKKADGTFTSFYKHVGKGASLGFKQQSAQLPGIRTDDAYSRWSSTSQQQILRRVNNSFIAFFRRVKAGQEPGYPRFKSLRHFDTIPLRHGDGARLDTQTGATRLYIQGIGTIKVYTHRPIVGEVKNAMSITRIGKHWYLNIAVDVSEDSLRKRPATGAMVGIDRGVISTVATSDGELISNPRHYRRSEAQLADKQRALSQCKRGSKRRKEVAAQVGAIHRKIRNQRRDFLHKLSNSLVNDYDFIALEKLKIENMTKTAKGTIEEPGTNVAQKTGLNKSILDAGWGILHDMIEYKAEEAGAHVTLVDPKHTSMMCFKCKHIEAGNRVGEQFECLSCGHKDHADINAAKNILQRGLDASPRNAQAA